MCKAVCVFVFMRTAAVAYWGRGRGVGGEEQMGRGEVDYTGTDRQYLLLIPSNIFFEV